MRELFVFAVFLVGVLFLAFTPGSSLPAVARPLTPAQLGRCVTVRPICPPGTHPECVCPGAYGPCHWECFR